MRGRNEFRPPLHEGSIRVESCKSKNENPTQIYLSIFFMIMSHRGGETHCVHACTLQRTFTYL